MTVTVPFQLRRIEQSNAASALLLPSGSATELLEVCKSLRHVTIFATASGFLILADDIPHAMPGCFRLSRLCENGYLPADAELIPSLSKTEAAELTQKRGLVFLPGGQILAFDPEEGRKPTDFLKLPPLRRHIWRSFPEVARPAPDLIAISIPPPPPDAPLISEPDGTPIGGEDPRPADSNLGSKILGKTSHSLGAGLGAIGKLIGNDKLSQLGKSLKDKGLSMAPRLTEGILGKQEAALQELLSKFQSGKIEEALRRAIPFSEGAGRGSAAHTGTDLPTNHLGFSLGSLFGGGGQAGGIWQGGNDETWRRLAEEYRKAANAAVARGDYRRAAMIYAKLLADFRTAAEVLSQGGLHRESARIFLEKLNDFKRAATEFEKAGDVDQALTLYLKTGDYEKAGDLLNRVGEVDRALHYYQQAALQFITGSQDFAKAGDYILHKTGRIDLAIGYFEKGWKKRLEDITADSRCLECASRLLELYANESPCDSLWRLVGEAEDWFRSGEKRNSEISAFFNSFAKLGELAHLASDRSQIRDRALVALSRQLKTHADYERVPGNIVNTLFGQHPHWSPEIVSDAAYALKTALKAGPRKQRPTRGVRESKLCKESITATAQARHRGTVFIAATDSSLISYDPAKNSIRSIDPPNNLGERIIGLAATEDGDILAKLYATATLEVRLSWYELQDGNYRSLSWTRVNAKREDCRLVQVYRQDGDLILTKNQKSTLILLHIDDGTHYFEIPTLRSWPELDRFKKPIKVDLHFITGRTYSGNPKSLTVVFEDHRCYSEFTKKDLAWQPGYSLNFENSFPHVNWLQPHPDGIEIAGIDSSGVLHFSDLRAKEETFIERHLSSSAPGGYRGVVILRSGRLAAITFSNQVQWLMVSSTKPHEFAPATSLKSPYRCVGFFHSKATEEVVVLMGDGTAFHVPVPT